MCDRHKVMQLNPIIRGRWRTGSCWHEFQWLQFTLTVNRGGVVERNASSDWLAFEKYGESCSRMDNRSDGYC